MISRTSTSIFTWVIFVLEMYGKFDIMVDLTLFRERKIEMAKVVPLKRRFRKPVPNNKMLRIKKVDPKTGIKIKDTGRRRGANKFSIKLPYSIHKELLQKAKQECGGASPMHAILLLLMQYYLNNEFIVHRRLVAVNDPSVTTKRRAERRKRAQAMTKLHSLPKKTVWLMIPRHDNVKFTNKAKRDGLTKNQIFDLLIQFYLSDQFIVTTKILRSAPYRVKNEALNKRVFTNRRREKREIEKVRHQITHSIIAR